MFTAMVVVFAALAVRFLTASRPFIGGVDFYYYILFARDLAGGAEDVPSLRYIYFPGVYSFWKTVFLVSDGSLGSLQWAYVGVLLANGVLIGGILASLTRAWQAGLFAAALYFFAAGRVEGLQGATEPVATIPYLLGLWLWVLLRGAGRPRAGLFALAAGLGLALFVKQQGGFLALGALALLPAAERAAPPFRSRLAQVATLAAGAALVFGGALLLEGGGADAVTTGLRFARDYQSEGSWVRHLQNLWTATLPISNLFLSGCAVWLAAVIARKRTPEISDAVMLTLGLSIVSATACLLQFSRRGYLHYGLLLLPSAVIAAGLAIHIVIAVLNRQARRWPRFAGSVAIAGTAAFLLINAAGTTDFIRFASAQIVAPTRWMPTETLARTFAPLCQHVRPGSDLMLIPSRQNAVHWFCRTRSVSLPTGYGWLPADAASYLASASSPSLAGVFVFSERQGEYEKSFFETSDRGRVFRELERLGYRETFSFEAGSLYRRTAAP